MCGICGKLNWDQREPVPPSLVREMTDVIQHRGPDGSGTYVWGPIGLGHRRLSIIDLDTGAQPMCNEDGTVWVVFNGEIYNFPELRSRLETLGHRFKSTSDTEVIVHAYEQWGERAVEELRGMFAFALWDQRQELLLLARDRVGIKPLYYTNTGNALLFGSEMKSLLVDPTVTRRIHPPAIDRFLTFHYLPGQETLVEGIYKLQPGHLLTASKGQIRTSQYWDLRFEPSERWRTLEDAAEALGDLLRQTVKAHMISDVPVGVLLSGGVDSTAILGHAATQTASRLRTFTVGFGDGQVADERPYARKAANRYGTEHHEITVTPEDFRDFLPKFVWHMEEPVCEPPAIALYFLSRLARDSSTKVLLSGEGGDEAFGGYETYRNLLLLERLKSSLGPAKLLLQLALKSRALARWRRASEYGDLVQPALRDYYLGRTATPRTLLSRWRGALYRSEFADSLHTSQPNGDLPSVFRPAASMSHLSHMLYVDTKSWLPDDLLIKADKMTMAASTELRVPLLDHCILEFAASLPSHFKVRFGSTKRVLKAAMTQMVPVEIVKRRKAGFPVPYERWLRTELRPFVADTLLSTNSALGDYFNRDKVRDCVQNSAQGAQSSKAIFSLLVLELWHRQFVMHAPRSAMTDRSNERRPHTSPALAYEGQRP